MNDDITTRPELILGLPWIVATTIDQQPAQPVTPEPAQPAHVDTPAVRPWAKPLLTGSLGLAAIWPASRSSPSTAPCYATIRLSVGLVGIPICCLIAISFLADPDHESGSEEFYVTLGSVPFAQCTPSRQTITGRTGDNNA